MVLISYWEDKTYFKNIDLLVIGSGIVGLNTALYFKMKNPKSKVLVLERGFLPTGASTKNAGFACFGSLTEILSDIKNFNEEEVWKLVDRRIAGLELLKKNLGVKKIDFKQFGGFELFDSESEYYRCREFMDKANKEIELIAGVKNNYVDYRNASKKFGFSSRFLYCIQNKGEGQIDTGKMMNALLDLCRKNGIEILNGIGVVSLNLDEETPIVNTNDFSIFTQKLAICTNGFYNELINKNDIVEPARAQVLITEPIANLKAKGSFHYDEGFVYFRNIDNRVLLGGARNKDFSTEKSTEFKKNDLIINYLEALLKKDILPNKKFKIERQWTGIMGMGKSKTPILKKINKHTVAAVRLGGMGVALGSMLGKEAAELLND